MEKKYKLVISSLAQKDLENIFKYISIDLYNKKAASELINKFEKAFNELCIYPECCPKVNNEYLKEQNLRKLVVKYFIAFYRIVGNEIQIVRVLHELRDYIKHL